MNPLPLPRCSPPLNDELLSSWLTRLARANHCAVEELCRYLKLRGGRAPETMAELADVDFDRLVPLLRTSRRKLVSMLLDEHDSFPIQCIARENFQHCSQCADQTPGLALRHWRFVWSLTCETCGSELVPIRRGNGEPRTISGRLKARAIRGAAFLKSANCSRSLRDARRIAFAVRMTGILVPHLRHGALISGNRYHRFTLLAAIGMCASRPLLKAAVVIRNDEIAVDQLRTAFRYQRRTLARIIKLSKLLGERIPRCEPIGQMTCKSIDAATILPVSGRHLAAARRAIEDLGPNTPRHKLLSHAAAILEGQ